MRNALFLEKTSDICFSTSLSLHIERKLNFGYFCFESHKVNEHTYSLSALLGSVHLKAECKMLVKLTPAYLVTSSLIWLNSENTENIYVQFVTTENIEKNKKNFEPSKCGLMFDMVLWQELVAKPLYFFILELGEAAIQSYQKPCKLYVKVELLLILHIVLDNFGEVGSSGADLCARFGSLGSFS